MDLSTLRRLEGVMYDELDDGRVDVHDDDELAARESGAVGVARVGLE